MLGDGVAAEMSQELVDTLSRTERSSKTHVAQN